MGLETSRALPSRTCIFHRKWTFRVVMSAALLVHATQPLVALPDAADPNVPVAPAKYRPAIRGYMPFRPVEPRDWQGVNREVAPQPKAEPKERDGQR